MKRNWPSTGSLDPTDPTQALPIGKLADHQQEPMSANDQVSVENGHAEPQKLPVEVFPPVVAAGASITQGPEDGETLAQHAVQVNREINATGGTLSQLYFDLGVTLLLLRAIGK